MGGGGTVVVAVSYFKRKSGDELRISDWSSYVCSSDLLSAILERHFGQKPQGARLTERVWESSVVPALADSGIRYVMVDDYHFMCTGMQNDKLNGYFSNIGSVKCRERV